MNNPEQEKKNIDSFKKKIIKSSIRYQKGKVNKKDAKYMGSDLQENNIFNYLDKARRNARIGIDIPSFEGSNILKRFLFRWIIRFIFKVLKVITFNQNNFNLSVIEIFGNNTDSIYDLKLQSANDKTQIKTRLIEQEMRLTDLDGRVNELSKVLDYFKNRVIQLEQKANDEFNDKNRTNIEKKENGKIKEVIDHDLDSLYVFLTDNLRGEREEIKKRLKVYLPIIKKAQVGTRDSPILDIGCGRGEWLELLKEQDLNAMGLDINRIMIKICNDLELNVIEEEALSFLKKNKNDSFGAVTGFHLIEHYEFESLNKLLNETFRVLKSGGVTIFETPNPDNIIVGSNTFYLDPSHNRPLPGLLVKLLMEAAGFDDIIINNLHPGKISFNDKNISKEQIEIFSKYFSGPQDYAIIGYKK